MAQPQNIAAADGPAPVSQARRVVSGVHADAISVFAENGGLVFGTKADVDGGLGVRLDPQLTSYNVEESTRTTVPAAPSYDFLGLAGSDVWIAPETNPGGTALWPGFSTEGVPSGLVDGNQLTLRLESVTGPGTLHIYQTSAFGEPSRLLSSTGLVYRAWTIPRGTHAHANWAFSAAGKYTLTFSVEAVTNGVSLTATQNYAFIVGDVPATIATATTLAANTNSLVIGQPVILTAAVTPTNALGWVEFRDGTAVLGHEVVTGDSAALTTTNLALGARSVTARFVPKWLNDFSASTSAPVSITVTDESGVPFSITGVAASYQPGETLNAQVAGVTLAAGQSIQWRIRPAGFGGQGGIFTGTGPNAAAGSLTQRMDPSFDGYELIAFLRQGTTTLAQTPWVLITVHNAVEPLSIAYEGPSPAYVGDPTTAVVSGRALLNGESFALVSRVVASRWSAIPQTLQTSERSFVVRPATSFNGKWAVQIVSNSLVVAQSAPIDVQILSREMFVEGVQGVYRPGQVLRATATVFPDPGALTYMWAFTDATATPLKQASDPEGRTLEQPITITDNGRRLLIVAFVDYGTHRGNAAQVVIPISVTALDPSIQLFFFSGLSDHYHQGYPINLNLVADPALADNDVLTWEWRWPNGDWAEFPGASGTHHSLIAEQALHDVQVRATVDFGQEGANPMTTPSLTIKVDDHGAPPSQQIAVTGVTNVVAGNLVTLTGSVSTASILTTYQWQKKPAGASEFTVISGVTNSTLIFPATMADDGAQYRVAIMKPNGTVAYGPSPVVTLDVAPPGLVPFTMPTFLDSSISSVAPSAQLADLNGDGKPDLAIVGAGVRYLLGTGDGSFLPAQFIQGSSGARNDLVAIDFDGDGDIDLLNTQANAGDTADILSLYRNDGAANFTRVELITSIPRPSHQLEAADLNGDGRPDAVYGKASTGVAYALQQADGSLGSEVVLPVTTTTASVQVADLDADGDRDIVVGNRTGSNGGAIFVFKNNGSGTFTAAPSISTGNFPSVLKIADMNGDGRVDIFTTQLIANTRAGWYPQLPDGTFGPRVNVMTAIGQLNSVEVADINEDGVPDIVAGVTLLVSGNLSFVSVWSAGQGGGVYSNPILLDPTQGNNTGMLVADLDGDSHPEIIATGNSDSQRPSAVRVLINKVGEDPMVLLTPAARIRVAGDPIDLEIYFGFPVTVTGTPRVALQVGPNTVFATYLSGSGTGRLFFRYLATATDVDLDGVQLASNVIDLNGGTILDPLNGNAALTFPNLAFNGVIVNGTGPLVQNMTRLDPTPTSAPSVRFQVQFAEAVTGVDVADFELKQDAGDLAGGNVLSVTGSGSTYEVSVATGTGSGTLGLSVKNAATIADLVGDPLAKGYVGGQVYTLKRGVPATISAIYRENHADYRPIWNNGEITFALDADPGTLGPVATVPPSDKVLTHAGPASIVARAAASTYDFIGVPAGSNVYVLPSSQIAGLPFLGISGESVPSGTFARYSPSTLLGDSRITSTNAYMRFQLVAMRSSSGGHMSIYTISSGNPRVWMATSDGINSMDAVYETQGGHSHRNVAFTKPGTYEVDVFVSGYRDANANTTYDPVTDPYIESGIFTMVFHVGDTSQVFALNRLADHYQQGDPVQLQLVADPVPAVGDTIAWEWRWPGGDWTPMPGAAGLSNSIVAEQALDGVQVRATLNVASNSTTIVAGPVTILMDDNGAPPNQVVTVSGATNVLLAGRRTTLLASVAPASVLTSYRWTIQRTNESSPTVIAGQETATLAFIPTQLDDGAAIRAALVSGNGSNYVESAPVMITVRTRGPGFNFTTARRYTLGHGDLRASYVNGALQVRYEIVSAAIVDGAPADSGHGTNVSYGVHELTVVLPNRPLEMPDIAADPLLADLAFIGAAAGEPVWFIPEGGIEAEQLGLPWLGYNTEELNAGDWTGDKIEIELVSVVAPDGARFSSSFNLDQGNPLVPHFATLDGITAADRFKAGLDGTETGLSTGTHSHVNWYFTKPGRYQVTLRFSGTHLVDGAKETTVTLGFVVAEPAPPAAGLRLAAANPAVGNATLSVATETGKTYQLENAPAVNGPWTSVGAPINGTGEPVQVVVPISGPTGFFRWRVADNP